MQTYLEREIDQLKRREHNARKNQERGLITIDHLEDVELEVHFKLAALEEALMMYKQLEATT